MRFRLIASYLGAPYQAALGPDGDQVTLFAACPPPEELGFTSATGHWRKLVTIADLDGLRQARPTAVYRGAPCLVLDDQGDRLHITYLGSDPDHARQLGYWEIDREVFEMVVPRASVMDLTEDHIEIPLAAVAFPVQDRPEPLPAPVPRAVPMPNERDGHQIAAWHGSPEPWPQWQSRNGNGSRPRDKQQRTSRSRVSIQAVFDELLDLAGIPSAAYAVDDEVPGAMCLVKTDDGFEVFASSAQARHEVRFFQDEEAAYLYLFGVLAAEAVRNGALTPSAAPLENISKYLRARKLPDRPPIPVMVRNSRRG